MAQLAPQVPFRLRCLGVWYRQAIQPHEAVHRHHVLVRPGLGPQEGYWRMAQAQSAQREYDIRTRRIEEGNVTTEIEE